MITYKCPNCEQHENAHYGQIVKCSCGIYRRLIMGVPPVWQEVKITDEEIQKFYNPTDLSRF